MDDCNSKCSYRNDPDGVGCGPAVVKSWYEQTNRMVFFCVRCHRKSSSLGSNRNRIYEPLRENTGLVIEFLVLWARQVRTLA